MIYGSAGIAFVPCIFILCTIFIFIEKITYKRIEVNTLLILLGVFSAAFTGYIDDNTDDPVKGITGHLKILLKRSITSGGIKAITGIFISLIISLTIYNKPIDIFISLLIICLLQNFINIMDLRPGRAVKSYFFLLILSMLVININIIAISVNLCTAILLIFYIPYEFKEICMMGDTGSNVLGIIIGITIALSDNYIFKLSLLFLLVCAQLFADTYSLSILIKNNPILNFIDKAGRIDNDKD
jgi:UDP-N-acetylmuramyl pentapeptide phosphotransferase/UDP-N-acetylglucosamine-1-phosphate transferase